MQIVLLSNEVDRLGIDTNEASWLIAWLMECYEKGLVTKKDLDGIELTWGNVTAVRALLERIVRREGIGNILAEGVRNSAQHMGEAAGRLAIYTKKGNTPRTHDHRSSWPMLIDTVTSDVGTDEDGAMVVRPGDVGLPIDANPCTHNVASTIVARTRGKVPFQDSLGMCVFNNWGMSWDFLANLLRATTGWDFTEEEALTVSRRIANLLRAFNIRHGLTADLDAPSAKYGSIPTDGPFKGTGILPHWTEIIRSYYEQMGWDRDTGKPLPETLRGLGLDHIISDIW
jgi:aldehyde:ferredoxin oxidoreductase